MEIKGTDRIAVVKPVASRPSSSIIWPLSGLLARGIRPLTMGPETGNGPIKPETIRFKPTINRAPPLIISSQVDDPKSDIKPKVLYRPLTKLVSKTAVSVLTNTAFTLIGISVQLNKPILPPDQGNFEPCDRPEKPPPSARVESIGHRIKKPHSYRTQLKSNFHEDLGDPAAAAGGACSSSPSVKDSRHVLPAASGDQLSYVGYNWRKYGQKQVKGSEYPRSYYKCTHPDCPVKRKVERSLDGQIAEIVYRGEHNHSKPQTPKRVPGTGQDMSDHLMSTRVTERNEGCECKAEASNNISLKGSLAYDCFVDREPTTAGLNRDDSCSLNAEHEDGNMRIGIDPDETRSKRRKTINQQNGVEINGEDLQEPAVSVQGSVVDPEILGDGFRWRKYGQKVVKGNPYPRSYYKCTSLECNVRKIVERALDDPTVFIMTYEGKHNHKMPLRSMSMPSSKPTLRATTSKEKLPF